MILEAETLDTCTSDVSAWRGKSSVQLSLPWDVSGAQDGLSC